MNSSSPRSRLLAIILAGSLVVPCLTSTGSGGADYGRLSGIVTDTQGSPLMGATILIVGPVLARPHTVDAALERVITDAHGKFNVEHLVPGWYSVRVTSATRLPALRNSIRVQAGQTSRQNFMLSDIFAPLRFQAPPGSASTWGDDWKWILRTSATTRPVLRYQEVARANPPSKSSKPSLPASQRLIGMMPGSTRHEPLAGDPGLGSVLAYLRPLSADADLLVAGSMMANGIQNSSLATALRKNMLKGDPQELALVVHQLSFSDEGLPFAPGEAHDNRSHAQGIVLSYAHTRHLSDSVSLTAGLEIDYLNAVRDALTARPRVKLGYRMTPSSLVEVRYGTVASEGDNTLLERIGVLNAFPRVTMQGYRLELEKLNHAEVSFSRRLSKASRVEVAAYRDYFQNTAVWGFGGPEVVGWMAGNVLPNPAVNGVTFSAGNYHSSGIRAAYLRSLGSHVVTGIIYGFGEALVVNPAGSANDESRGNLQGALRADHTQTFAGKVSARIPTSKTQFTTSYEWLQRGRVTGVDPYGQASLQLQPFLDVEVRQPLPALAFLPAHIEALVDFRNLLAEGYVPLVRPGYKPLLLTPAYRSFRGGFSVQF